MGLCRRRFLHLAAGAAVLPAASRIARAQPYPSRPVKIIVGQAAGSASDLVARVIAQFLSEKLGQQFLVEVRPGAAGNIATEAVTHMPPDGYTLLLVNSQNAINVALYEKLSFDFVRDIAPVGKVESVPLVMEVHPSVPVKTISEFIAYAKANPGKLNMASAGIGGPQHIAGELFKFMAGGDRSRRRPGASDVRRYADLTAPDQGRKNPAAGRDDDGTTAIPAGRADDRQRPQGLRGGRLDRFRRS